MTHVLIVEDWEADRMLLKMRLQRNGYRVTAAGDGLEALAAARRDPPDAILSDMMMPKMDGFALCRAWMQDVELSAIPFIFYSATDVRTEDEQFAMALGAVRYLIKPMEEDAFLRELRTVLQQWAGRPVAPDSASPLDDANYRALHASALARKMNDKSIATVRDIAERRLIEEALRNSEAELEAAQRVARIGNWYLDLASGAVRWSEEIYRVFGRDPDLPPPTFAEQGQLLTVGSAERLHAAAENSKQTGALFDVDLEVPRADGTTKWIAARGEAVRDDNGQIVGLRGTAQDISERKEAEDAIRKSNRALRVLSSCNQALIRVSEEQQLFEDICQIVVKEGGYRLAWVGTAEQDANKSVRPVAQAGFEEGYLDALKITWADTDRGRGPTGSAVRTGSTQVNQHFATNPRVAPWREHALKHGYGSSIALPLKSASAVLGALTLYAVEPNAFDAEEVKLLEELADDLAFGVTVLRTRAAHTRAEIAVRDSEQKFKDLLESAPDAMVIVNAAAEIMLVNAQTVNLFGWPREELLGQKIQILIPERLSGTHSGKQSNFFAPPRPRPMGAGLDLFGLRKDGTEFPAEISLSPLGTNQGTLAIAAIRDVTERKAAQARVTYLNRVYAVLSGINTLIVRVRDRDELFSEACRIAVEAGGFRMALIAIVDRNTTKIVPVASAGKDEELLTSIKGILSSSEGAPTTMTALALREKKAVVSNDSQSDPRVVFGKKYAEAGVRSLAVLPLIVADEAVGALALYASEREFFHEDELKLLTELAGDIGFAIDYIDKQARLDYLAYYDVLTGLANRALFLERMAQYMRSAVSAGHQLALFLVDLERFKNINDSLGRPAGDDLLKQVAQWLTRNTAGDVNLLARVGADHFAVVMPVVKQEGSLTRLLEQWIEAVQNHPFRLNDAVFRITFKVGVALFPDDGADADTLFKNAEAALKKTKASGERYLFYTQKMTSSVASQLTLENQLRQALDKGEFVLHYQPKVNLASGKMTSAEALIRWNDPRTGLVPPGRFIPILEETGLIYEVGRWALRQAIGDYLRWHAAGLPAVRIAVNVSPLQLRHPDFIAEIKRRIDVDVHAAAGLELEITESLIMENVKHSIASLQAIRAMGVSIAIDDFGTGFSSLSYLSKFPVDTLKIDRSFVIEMTNAPEGQALVSTIISLAHSLKLKVVAEGVETEEQSHLLRLLNCDEMQGYLFSKPVPGEIFESRFLAPPPGG